MGWKQFMKIEFIRIIYLAFIEVISLFNTKYITDHIKLKQKYLL